MNEVTAQDMENLKHERLMHEAHLKANKEFAEGLAELRTRYPKAIQEHYAALVEAEKDAP
jgi:hypothetical protein